MNTLEMILASFNRDQKRIAEWYHAQPSHPRWIYDIPTQHDIACVAWYALRDESRTLANVVRKLVTTYDSIEAEPYRTAGEMFQAIEADHFEVSKVNCDHPLWTPADNVNFRIVHDVLGHYPACAAFDWQGEVAACVEHASHLSELAQHALFSECIGQTAYRCHFGHFGPQKIVLPRGARYA